MKVLKSIIAIFILLLAVLFCYKNVYNKRIVDVFEYYTSIDNDSLKLEAARFICDNIQYHYSDINIIEKNDEWEQWRVEVDDIVIKLQKEYGYDAIPRVVIDSIQAIRDSMLLKCMPEEICLVNYLHCDTSYVTSEFLIEHIDNAFEVWRNNEYAKKLSFEDFKEYILPYSSLQLYGFLNTGKRLNKIFLPILCLDSAKTLTECVCRYNLTIGNIRNLNGANRRKYVAGLYDMYVHGIHDCIDIAVWGCNILRACGVPTVVENVIGYRDFVGEHYYCSVYDADSGKWLPFNAESSLPGNFSFENPKCLNVYRHLYAAQKNTPYFLKGESEAIPAELSNPCIKDVTSEYCSVYKVSLAGDSSVANKLAYLATFNAQSGIKVTTWGVVDSITNHVTFDNVIPKILYMPVYYTDKGFKSFSQPFYLTINNGVTEINYIPGINNDSTTTSLYLTRKFPHKESMKRVADGLIGGRFLGASNSDFSEVDVLYTINDAPLPALKEYKLNKIGSYKYYRFQAPKENPQANISHLEWITNKNFGYENSDNVTRTHCLNYEDTLDVVNDSLKVKLLDRDSHRMTWAKEYDGNMQTAPGAYPNITLTLDEPQIVTAVRFAPLNADNGIKNGNVYELFYWEDGWISCGIKAAKYEFIEFKDVPINKIYWLKNHTEGKEEMPFIIVDDEQKFIYSNIISTFSI